MRRGLLIAGWMAAAGLGGCASVDQRPVQGMSWGLDASQGGDLKLTLGVPDTDDLFLIFVCPPRSGAIELTAMGAPADGAAVELRSGKVWNRYRGAGAADEEAPDGYDIQVHLSADDPVLRSVADTGDLTVVLGRRRTATPNAFAPFHDFLDRCRPPGG
jgi:hypothetical protein